MRSPRLLPFAGAAALACALAGASLAVPGRSDDLTITGARFSFSARANTVSGAHRGVSTLAGDGNLRTDRKTRVVIHGSLRRAGGARLTLSIEALSWSLAYREPRATLTLAVRVLEVGGQTSCRQGTRGTLVLVDDDRKLQNGASADSTSLRFNRVGCGAFARKWSNDDDPSTDPVKGGPGGGQRALVEIEIRSRRP